MLIIRNFRIRFFKFPEMDPLINMEDGFGDGETSPLMVQTRTTKAQQARNAGMQRIQKDMFTVNQLFKDLSGIVIQQGESITAIAASVEKTLDHSSKAGEEVMKTDKRHRQQQMTAIRLAGCFLMFIIMIFLIRTYIFH